MLMTRRSVALSMTRGFLVACLGLMGVGSAGRTPRPLRPGGEASGEQAEERLVRTG